MYLSFVYLSYNKEYTESIKIQKNYLNLTDKKDSTILYKIYYSLSNNYEALKDYKNAYYYAQLSKSYFKDTLNYADFLLYKHLGDLALKADELKSSAYAYQKAFLRQNESITRQTDKKVLEIEKKYHYQKNENEQLKAQKTLYVLLFLCILMALMLFIGLLLRNRHLIKERNGKLKTENDRIKFENEEKILKQTTLQKTWINTVYAYIVENNSEQMDVYYKLRIHPQIKKDKSLSELVDNMENNYKIRTNSVSKLQLDEYTFSQLTGMTPEQAQLLNDSDKLLFALLKCDLKYRQIAAILGSSYDSIRMRKRYILDKLSATEQK
ncbi:MAG: hypothetical protein QM751_04260 [Paludibacteraceae bacterium]